MMDRYPRVCAWCRWGGAALTVLLAMVWARSAQTRSFRILIPPTLCLHFEPGRIGVEHFAQKHYMDTNASHYMVLYSDNFGEPVRWRTEIRAKHWRGGRPYSMAVFIPLSLPVALVGLPTCWLWRRHWQQRRREQAAQRGLCPECRYNLRGNTSGACPECGTLVRAVQPRSPAPSGRWWGGAVATLLLSLVTVISSQGWALSANVTRRLTIGIRNGEMHVEWHTHPDVSFPDVPTPRVFRSPNPPRPAWWIDVGMNVSSNGNALIQIAAVIPLWIMATMVGLPTCAMGWRERSVQCGMSSACGCIMRDATTGVRSECGVPRG